ncbi:hypothetical protein RND81_14G213700 [Saponaria officinalis]|uniref:Dirigent protein n=1 Tax=Saponaria officinalis TaxID=3572 RepID=A0AAW1GV75_SAPOF
MTKLIFLIPISQFLVLTTIVTNPYRARAELDHSNWAETITQNHYERKTTIQFYFHVNITGDYLTAVKIARAGWMWGRASSEDSGLFMGLVYVFYEGIYNGSSVSIMDRNWVSQPVREMPVVGGTGLFRMARGFALARNYFSNTTSLNAIVGYNVTIFHS